MADNSKPLTLPNDLSGPKLNIKMDAKWFLAILAVLILIVLAVVLNINHGSDSSQQVVDTVDTDNGDLKINWDRFETFDINLSTLSENALNITKSGSYHVTGTLANGYINVNPGTEGIVRLVLDNATIANATGPAISCIAGDDLVIELIGDNFLKDGTTYSANYDADVTGAVYSKADLTFMGDGHLDLVANYQDGIVGKDDVKFSGGTYDISAKDDGIRGKDSVYVTNGDFVIKSGADAIKSTNETDLGKGFVLIENGNFSINSGDDGIHANSKLVIDGGIVTIAKSYEGLEAQVITINGGQINLTTSDDGINAGGGADSSATNRVGAGAFDADESCILSINGGNIYINASGDGIDSNGWLYFNGGKVVVDGPTNNGNGALDAGMGIVMNGGEVIAVGASGMAETLGSNSSVYNASIYLASTQQAGTTIEIKDASGSTIIKHTSAKSFNHIAAGSELFKLGETYTIYLNGAKYQTFTISNITTTVGNTNTNQQMVPGGRR